MNLDSLENILTALDKIQGWSAALLVFATCIAVGYVLRFVKSFPNDGIPVAVVLWGAVAMLFLADGRPTSMQPHVWTARNVAVGVVIGFFSWIGHKFVLSRIETLIGQKISSGDTVFFNKPRSNPDPIPRNDPEAKSTDASKQQ